MKISFQTPACFNTHSHVREGDPFQSLVRWTFTGGSGVIGPQPNAEGGLDTTSKVLAYKKKIHQVILERDLGVIPFLMITPNTSVDTIKQAVDAGILDAKIYPFNRTTKSEKGVRHYSRLIPVVRAAGEGGMRVHFHPEHPWMTFDNRDAEYQFLSIMDMFLNEAETVLFWEHATDARCVPFWKEMAESGRFFITLTAHHLASNEDELFGDVRGVCKPPVKTRRDALDLVRLVSENHSWVMAGADDAPHPYDAKHPDKRCCACGAYTAPFLMALYAHALDGLLWNEESNALRPDGMVTFMNFTSGNAKAEFTVFSESRPIRMIREPSHIPSEYQAGPWTVQPFWAGQVLKWRMEEVS